MERRLHLEKAQSSGGSLLGKNDPILVIIDMQERLIPVIADKEIVIENVVRLAKFSTIIGLPVVLTEQQNLGDTLPEIREELKDIPPITKLEFNCFGSHAFSKRIGKQDRNTLIIAGIEAHICVAQTALHAHPDYAVHVVSDAVSSRALHNRDVALHRMRQKGITVTSTEMVIYELLGKAGTDMFREVLKLVK
jgi:isochorismate hydrolase